MQVTLCSSCTLKITDMYYNLLEKNQQKYDLYPANYIFSIISISLDTIYKPIRIIRGTNNPEHKMTVKPYAQEKQNSDLKGAYGMHLQTKRQIKHKIGWGCDQFGLSEASALFWKGKGEGYFQACLVYTHIPFYLFFKEKKKKGCRREVEILPVKIPYP